MPSLGSLVAQGQRRIAATSARRLGSQLGSIGVAGSFQVPTVGLLDPALLSLASRSWKDHELWQALYGWAPPAAIPNPLHVVSDADGVIELTNLGYLRTGAAERPFLLCRGPNGVFLTGPRGESARYEVVPQLYLASTPIEFRTTSHPSFAAVFEGARDSARRMELSVRVEVDSDALRYRPLVESSLALIRVSDPNLFHEICEVCRWFVVLSGDGLVGLTALGLHGAIFVLPPAEPSRLFFSEHIIHEAAHVALNAALVAEPGLFSVDPLEPRFASPFRSDARGLYQAFQAAFVLGRIAGFLSRALQEEYLEGLERLEAVGRLSLTVGGLTSALGSIGFRELFSDAGWQICRQLLDSLEYLRSEHEGDLERLNMAGQAIEFDFPLFLRENSLLAKRV